MGVKSKVLIFGGTGYIGKHIARASAAEGHPTSIFSRPATLQAKAELIETFKADGITIVEGSLDDHAAVVAAIKEVDVVISALGGPAVPLQEKIVAAIKEAGNVKRFLPSEYGNDVDHCKALEPLNTIYGKKVTIRRLIEEAGIPYTYVSSNAFAGYTLANLVQFGKPAPPRDRVTIYGSGDVKAVFVKEEDIGVYTVKTIDDPRTLNKVVYLRPAENILTVNEVVALWEKKIGHSLEKEYVSEEVLIEQIKTSPIPKNIVLSTIHNIFVKGDQTNFEVEEKGGLEASKLYPDVKYTTASEYLDKYV
eukprot:c20226_g1_i1 orf=244-1164(+)